MVAGGIFASLHLSSDGPVWVLVGLDRVVGPDPAAQAAWTWRLLVGVGLIWAVGAWVSTVKSRVSVAWPPTALVARTRKTWSSSSMRKCAVSMTSSPVNDHTCRS